MTKFLEITAAIFCLLLCQNLTHAQTQHVGVWQGVSKGKIEKLELEKDGHITLTSDGETIGGKSFEINGRKGEARYEINYDQNPIWLDIVIYEKGQEKEKGRLKGIVRFLSNDKIEYRIGFSGGERPANFFDSAEEDAIILDRVIKK